MNNNKTIKKLTLLVAPLFLAACSNLTEVGNNQETTNDQQTTPPKTEKYTVSKANKTSSASSAVTSLLARAQQQQNSGDDVAAISSLERAIRIAPRYPESYYRLAEIHYKQGQNAQARSLAEKAISLGASGALQTKSQALIEKTK